MPADWLPCISSVAFPSTSCITHCLCRHRWMDCTRLSTAALDCHLLSGLAQERGVCCDAFLPLANDKLHRHLIPDQPNLGEHFIASQY